MSRRLIVDILFEGGDLEDKTVVQDVVKALRGYAGVERVRYRTLWAGADQKLEDVLVKVDAWVSNVLSFDEHPVQVVTDGGCRMKLGIGAYAYIISGAELDTVIAADVVTENVSNNRTEMLAVIRALQALPPHQKVLVTSDSKYVIDGSVYMYSWAKQGWRRNDGGKMVEVKNTDLWKMMWDLHRRHDVTFKHVHGHSGDFLNETVDMLCNRMMDDHVAKAEG